MQTNMHRHLIVCASTVNSNLRIHFIFSLFLNAWSGIPVTTSYGEAALAFMHQAAGATD